MRLRGNESDVMAFDQRRRQYEANVESHKTVSGLVFESLEDFSLKVISDDYGIFSKKVS